MTESERLPPPPRLPGLAWRPLRAGDLDAIAALAATCLERDGGLPLAASREYLAERCPAGEGSGTIGAFAGERLAACAAVRPEPPGREPGAGVFGQVHPEHRGQGMGRFLLAWSAARAEALLAGLPEPRPRVLSLTTESYTDAAGRLYARHGWTQQMLEQVMRLEAGAPLPAAELPAEVSLAEWSDALAPAFYEVYHAAFRERPGFPGWDREQWTAWATDDEEFRPELSLLARVGGKPVGFIIADPRYIVQTGVRPGWRGRGIGSGLVAEVLRRAREAGGGEMLLTVNADNPGAERVYRRLGFRLLGRRARFTKRLD